MKDEELKCEYCGSGDAFECNNPYYEDVHGEFVKVLMCDDCYDRARDDI